MATATEIDLQAVERQARRRAGDWHDTLRLLWFPSTDALRLLSVEPGHAGQQTPTDLSGRRLPAFDMGERTPEGLPVELSNVTPAEVAADILPPAGWGPWLDAVDITDAGEGEAGA